ncbi:hypothetical protein TNCV_4585581 [Trichonephila clavipes]|nr:hypothetical protein TNCV_4585581 [Trichonephila clavipes]
MQILRPTLIHACPIWGHAAHSNINQIEIAQNLILRTITKADWYIRNADIRSALNIKTLKEEQSELTNPDRCSHSSFSLQSPVHPPRPPRVAASRLAEPNSPYCSQNPDFSRSSQTALAVELLITTKAKALNGHLIGSNQLLLDVRKNVREAYGTKNDKDIVDIAVLYDGS